MSSRDDADAAAMGFRSSEELSAWQRQQQAAYQPPAGQQAEPIMQLVEAYAKAAAAVDFWSGKVKASALLDAAYVARDALHRALSTPPTPEAEPAQQDTKPLICGQNPTPIDADLVGCGKPIDRPEDVYRCTDCAVPFHRACAVKHFATDTPEHAAKVYEEQLRRLGAAS